MQVTKTVRPVVSPVHLDEMKLHLRVDHTTDDTLIQACIDSAVDYCETFCNRQMVTATLVAKWDKFPATTLPLPRPPLQSVSSVTYLDTSAATQTLATTEYSIYTNREPGEIRLGYSKSWPSTYDVADAVSVTYKAGYMTRFTAANTTEILTWSDRAPVTGEVVFLYNSGGALPTGLAANTPYYVINAGAQTCQLSTSSGGTAATFTSDGTGSNFIGVPPPSMIAAVKLAAADLYEHRESQMDARVEHNPTITRLLWLNRSIADASW